MAVFRQDIRTTQSGSVFVVIVWAVTGLLAMQACLCGGQRTSPDRNLRGIMSGVENFRGFLVELSKIVTGTEIYKEQGSLSVVQRTPDELGLLLEKTKTQMESILNEKKAAVQRLKTAAQNAMKTYGPYNQAIDFNDVRYVNAKEVVIDKDLENLAETSRNEIKRAINYLRTEPVWNFLSEGPTALNPNTSSIHVPTNIYDKYIHIDDSEKYSSQLKVPSISIQLSWMEPGAAMYPFVRKSTTILNGIEWSTNLTSQFVANSQLDPNLKWQYFCSSDGVFRLYPATQWPRKSDQVDTFDCRIRKWYIQAATSPKNILILLDWSGSMKGLRFGIARSTVTKILDTLSDEDYFNIIKFSDEPTYVDTCFNDTLITASFDNIKRIQDTIADLEPNHFSNFEKALTKAFIFFKKEQIEFHEHTLCNKAILIITDGAPENFDSVFSKFNWPEKSIRVFTFLIGKEVPDNRQTLWMACANKGEYMHISTRADVQEHVQKYIKVLSRPLAITKAVHEVWSPVYLDYVTQQGDILIPAVRPQDLHMDYEAESNYKGLGLVMTMSMPVYDERTEVGPREDSPERNLLGVVGTDLRVNELMRVIPTFELGVNGYAFAITNHGYILFHPDYRPFYSDNFKGTRQNLKVKPKYNSVDLSEVEIITANASGFSKEHPLRKYLLMSQSGGHNMSYATVLTHSEGMKRAKERRNHYQFTDVASTFKLVFVVPDDYGTRSIQVDPKYVPTTEKLMERDETVTTIELSSWIYCNDGQRKILTQLDDARFYEYISEGTLEKRCGKTLAQRLKMDLQLTMKYAQVWEGTVTSYVRSSRENKYVKEYEKCWGVPGAKVKELEKKMCYFKKHSSNGIDKIWIGTSSGITRHLHTEEERPDPDWAKMNKQTIRSPYYKRAVDGWEDGYKFVFAGPVISTQKEFNFNTSTITVSTVEKVGKTSQVPAAVVAYSMKYSAFYEKFLQHAANASNLYSCSDTEQFYCYLIDNNGYILATNNPDRNGTGLFLGQHNGRLMRSLLDDNVFKQLKLTDFQSMCETPVPGRQESSSAFITSPLKLVAHMIFWLISQVVLLLSKCNILGFIRATLAAITDMDALQCGDWIPEEIVRYICGFIVDEDTGRKNQKDYIIGRHSCAQGLKRYTLNLNVLNSKVKQYHMADCSTQCASTNKISYEARWLNETNMVFLVVDASCVCNSSYFLEGDSSMGPSTSRFMFPVKAIEVTHNDSTQCQILLNFSEELKHVDETRTQSTVCLDSTTETDTPCSQSPAFSHTYGTSLLPIAISVLVLIVNYCSH